MIRIIDEPVFEMTRAEVKRKWYEYVANDVTYPGESFEEWLEKDGWPFTVQGRIKP